MKSRILAIILSIVSLAVGRAGELEDILKTVKPPAPRMHIPAAIPRPSPSAIPEQRKSSRPDAKENRAAQKLEAQHSAEVTATAAQAAATELAAKDAETKRKRMLEGQIAIIGKPKSAIPAVTQQTPPSSGKTGGTIFGVIIAGVLGVAVIAGIVSVLRRVVNRDGAKVASGVPSTVAVRIYKGSQSKAARNFRADASRMATQGYYPSSQVWAPGTYGTAAFLIAAILCVVVVGILIFIYMILVKPAGYLTVTYELKKVSAPPPLLPQSMPPPLVQAGLLPV